MELKATYPYYLANRPEQPNADLAVVDKYTGQIATRVAQADAAAIDRGIAAAVGAAEPMTRFAPYERQGVLEHCVQRFRERQDELAYSLCVEAGKPIRDSRGEVSRLIEDLTISHQGGWYSVISLHGGGSPEAMKKEIFRRYPIAERVELVENLLDRGMLADARRRITIGRQPGRCCATGCQTDD